MSDRSTDLALWLDAEPLPTVHAPLPSGRSVDVARFVRRDRRAAQPIEKIAPCWAPNKPAIQFMDTVTWPEFAVVHRLEAQGWTARWLVGWGNQRTPCVDVGRAGPLAEEVGAILARIDRRAGVDPGGGGWDLVAWRGAERLFIDVKPYRDAVRLDGNQARWLGAALDEGFSAADFAIVESDVGVPQRRPMLVPPARQPRQPGASRPTTSSGPRATRSTPSTGSSAATPRPRTSRESAPLPRDIAELLDRARAASPNERIGYRDQIARAGQPAIRAMEVWIATGIHPGFAVRVMEAAARLDWATESRAALRRALATADASTKNDIEAALVRLKPTRKT
jgi:hypothetical protein